MSRSNSLYHALSHQLFGTDDNHMYMRRVCLEHIEQNKSYFRNFVDVSFEQVRAQLRARWLSTQLL